MGSLMRDYETENELLLAKINELVHKLRYLERNKSRIRDEDWLSVIELIAKHKGE